MALPLSPNVLLLLFVLCGATSTSASLLTQQFDVNQAYRQLIFSYSSYCTQSSLANWGCFFCSFNKSLTEGFKVSSFIYNSTHDIFGYVGFNGDTVEVVFRGTVENSLQDWLDDIEFFPIKPFPSAPKAFVHGGFMEAYESIRLDVKTAVVALVAKIKPSYVIITGHSLGAAIATLCAAELAPLLPVPVQLYTYGSPRVGNSYFVQYFENLVKVAFRMTYSRDLVPHLPLTALDFHHIPTEVWFKTPASYTVCDSIGEDPHCIDSVQLPWSIYDHLHYLNITLHQGGC